MTTPFIPVARVLAERPRDTRILVGWQAGVPVSFGVLRGRVAALARRIDGDTVIASASPLSFLVALLALWAAGRTAIVPASLQPEAIAAASRGAAAVLRDDVLDTVSGDDPGMLVLPPARRCLLALYTSGSTGTPKRVDKALHQLDREIENLHAQWSSATEGCCVLSTVPHYHIYGLLFRLLWPLAAGRPAEDVTCAEPQQLREVARQRGRYALVSTPAHLSRFPDLMAFPDWRRPQIVFSSGGPLSSAAAAQYRAAFGAAPAEVFGSTETGGVAWRQRDGSAGEDAWTPFPGIGISLDEDGALILDSAYLAERRWRMDDAAELLADGRFALRGRLDRVVKIEGKRLSLPELEMRLETHPWISAACGVVLPPPQRLGAVLVLSPAGAQALRSEGARAMHQGLRRHLAAAFDSVLLPRHFRFVDALPVTDRGKLSSADLQGLFRGA